MENRIKKYLENIFNIQFTVQKNYNDFEEYIIKPAENLKDTFFVKLIIKENIRITLIAEPDVYGKNFIENINFSKIEQRNISIKYWEKLGESKIKLIINDDENDIDDFLENKDIWKKFVLKFTKNAYYDESEENKEDAILSYTALFMAMILSITTYEINNENEEIILNYNGVKEGTAKEIKSIRYERNPINRQICLAYKGYRCSVCGFDFEKVYGILGRNFIEVHHILPVSKMGDNYEINPIKDLTPLCSNCHSMIHKKNPPYTIDELKKIIEENKK